ncbi:MAG TPA: hypothetical protein VIO37_12715 [Candidatus Dormibacteraeota bacterium]|jgi:hypothetical protein
MTPEIETAEEPSVEKDVEATLREVRAFLDDPVALLERALQLLVRRAALESVAMR